MVILRTHQQQLEYIFLKILLKIVKLNKKAERPSSLCFLSLKTTNECVNVTN